MRKTPQRLVTLILIINFTVAILQGAVAVDNSKITSINESVGKNRLETIKEKGVITIATPSNNLAFFVLDNQTNKITGIDAEIISEIARRLGINGIEIKESPFSDLLGRLGIDNSMDIAAGGIYITPEREEVAAFTQPLYSGSEVVIVPTFSTIQFKNDLKNAVVGVERGTIFQGLAETWKKNNLIKDVVIFEDTFKLLNAINSKSIDAGISDTAIINYFLKEDKNLSLRVLKGYTPELSRSTGIAVRKSDTELLNALNEKINEMKADGTLYAILIQNGFDKDSIISGK